MVFCPLLNLPCEIMLCIKISDFIPRGEAGCACEKDFHNWLSAMLFKFPSSQAPREVVPRILFGAVVVMPSFLFGKKTPSQTRTTNVFCTRDVVPRMINKERILFPMHIRCTIPRGDAVCLIAADVQVPQNVSVGHGAEAVLCPLYQKKLWKRTSFILISLGAGFHEGGTACPDEISGTEVVSRPLHLIMFRTSLSIPGFFLQ
jgi:hypothetical protein